MPTVLSLKCHLFTTAMVQWSLAAQQNKICTLCWLGWLGQICTANCNLKISVSHPEFHFFCHPALNMWCFSSILCGFLQETIFMTRITNVKNPKMLLAWIVCICVRISHQKTYRQKWRYRIIYPENCSVFEYLCVWQDNTEYSI